MNSDAFSAVVAITSERIATTRWILLHRFLCALLRFMSSLRSPEHRMGRRLLLVPTARVSAWWSRSGDRKGHHPFDRRGSQHRAGRAHGSPPCELLMFLAPILKHPSPRNVPHAWARHVPQHSICPWIRAAFASDHEPDGSTVAAPAERPEPAVGEPITQGFRGSPCRERWSTVG